MTETKRKNDLFDIVSGLENLMISANRAADLLEILDEGLTEEIEGAAKDDPVFRHLCDRYSMFHSLMDSGQHVPANKAAFSRGPKDCMTHPPTITFPVTSPAACRLCGGGFCLALPKFLGQFWATLYKMALYEMQRNVMINS